MKRVLGPLSEGVSAYTESTEFVCAGGVAELRCMFEKDGSMVRGGLRFFGVRAYRYRTEPYCTVWHLDEAYDMLVEVEHSSWVAQLHADEPPALNWSMPLRHFLIYIDDAGAYEIVAGSYEWLPQVVVESGRI